MNYIKDFPCPHCGSTESLTDREAPPKPIIPEELQYDFSKGIDYDAKDELPPTDELTAPLSQTGHQPDRNYSLQAYPLSISQNVPLDPLMPPPLANIPLTPPEQKVYLQLSVEFHIILNNSKTYREGIYNWNLLLPDRLQTYGLTNEAWERIAAIGDADTDLQANLTELLKKVDASTGITRKE
ncbi:MAG: hypothetical protein ACFFD4_30075 [Candidatus Odinarchaeota archaeon]